MKLNSMPHPVLHRLLELDNRASALARAADMLERERERARATLNGQRTVSHKFDRAQAQQQFNGYQSAPSSRT